MGGSKISRVSCLVRLGDGDYRLPSSMVESHKFKCSCGFGTDSFEEKEEHEMEHARRIK